MHYLYKITNLLNSKIYIGQSIKEKERWRQHKYFGRNPEKTGQYIHQAMNKYGVENFTYEVIAICKSTEDANEIEKQLILQYESFNKNYGYNISAGGDPAWNRGLPSEQQPMFGKHHSEESKLKSSKSNTGKKKPCTDERRARMVVMTRLFLQNNPHNQTGRKHSEETKKKRSLALRKFDPITEQKIFDMRKNGFTYKKIAQEFNSNESTINNICKRMKK